MRAIRRASILVLIVGILAAAPAADATTVVLGSLATQAQADAISTCGGCRYFQQSTGASSASYSVPAGSWVLTSWSTRTTSATAATGVRMFLLEPQGGDNYLLRAQSNPQAIPGGTIGTQLVQIPVQPGWLLGIDTDTGGVSGYITGDSSDVLRFYSNDIVGMSGMATTTLAGRVVNLTARLESDCDADGLGDDTQDPDISACNPPTPTTDTTAPDTTITKHPKDKTKKKQAVFEFSSSEAGSTFECALDGAAFAPCTSPDTLKVKKGKHSFNVRAKDAAGNVDGSPATDSWKVKKKRK